MLRALIALVALDPALLAADEASQLPPGPAPSQNTTFSISGKVSGAASSNVQDFRAVATQCAPPSVSFKWVGTRGAYMTTNAKFVAAGVPMNPPGPPPAKGEGAPGAHCPGQPVSPSIRIRDREGQCLVQIRDVKDFRHCGTLDSGGCTDQVFPVAFDSVDSGLLANGYRVSVEFTGLQDCSGQVRVEDVPVLEQHHLAIDLGSSLALDAAGSLVSHLELALNSNSRWKSWLYGDVDIRLVTLEVGSGGDQQQSLTKGAHLTVDGAGRALLAFACSQSCQPWLVPVLGLGLRSIAPAEFTDVRGRAFVGARLQVLGYNAGEPAETFGNSRGFVEAGYARDQFWRDSTQNRYYAEGQIEIPSFGSKWIRLLLRFKIDRGFGPPGQSEARVSVLTSINPSTLGALLGFSPKK